MKAIQDLLKNKKVLIAAGVVVLILVLGVVAMLVLGKGSNTAANQAANQEQNQAPVLTLQPADIGLAFVPASDMQRGTMTITKTSDISSVDYQLTYTAVVSGQPVSRGTIGHADVKNAGQVVSQQMVFGTCSDVCHYDTGITDVKLIVKVTKTNGNVYQVELSVPVPAAQ
jgi:Tfp pilus assembly protein PilW